jgi:hypothetical protein
MPHRNQYSPEQIDAGLTAMACVNGNRRKAVELLERAGKLPIPAGTLTDWVQSVHKDRYAQIREAVLPALNARMAESHEALVDAYNDLQWEAIDQVKLGLPEANASQASNIAKNAAIGAGIHTEKAQLRRGMPTQIHGQEDLASTLKALASNPAWRKIVQVDPRLLVEGDAHHPHPLPQKGTTPEPRLLKP